MAMRPRLHRSERDLDHTDGERVSAVASVSAGQSGDAAVREPAVRESAA